MYLYVYLHYYETVVRLLLFIGFSQVDWTLRYLENLNTRQSLIRIRFRYQSPQSRIYWDSRKRHKKNIYTNHRYERTHIMTITFAYTRSQYFLRKFTRMKLGGGWEWRNGEYGELNSRIRGKTTPFKWGEILGLSRVYDDRADKLDKLAAGEMSLPGEKNLAFSNLRCRLFRRGKNVRFIHILYIYICTIYI